MVLLLLLRTTYVEQYYGEKIDIDSPQIQNYQSTKNNRKRSSVIKDESLKVNRSTLGPPGEIKNGVLLKQGKNRNELMPNLVELDNYICLPETIWNRLVAIYHGGPPIQRTYPKIYHNFIIKASLTEDAKFYYRTLKYSKIEDFEVRRLAKGR